MDTTKYCYDGTKKYRTGDIKSGDTGGLKSKEEGKKLLAKNQLVIDAQQQKLYAEGTQSLLVLFQAMDAAGKDGTIRHVFSGVNPQGVLVSSFKQPSKTELEHDYLWRIHNAAPPRGIIGIFNRSHYEEVLVTKVLGLPATQPLPRAALKDIWKRRYRQIADFERHLHENGTTILKFYLCLSKQEQTARFLSRLEEPAKNWKFSTGDVETSTHWDDYMKAYREAINATAAPHAPWYVVPADKKWYARALVSQVVADALKAMRPAFPKPEGKPEELAECRTLLQAQQQAGG